MELLYKVWIIWNIEVCELYGSLCIIWNYGIRVWMVWVCVVRFSAEIYKSGWLNKIPSVESDEVSVWKPYYRQLDSVIMYRPPGITGSGNSNAKWSVIAATHADLSLDRVTVCFVWYQTRQLQHEAVIIIFGQIETTGPKDSNSNWPKQSRHTEGNNVSRLNYQTDKWQ